MVEQYPDNIVFDWKNVPTLVNGEWTQTGSDSHTTECRAETNLKNGKVRTASGLEATYQFAIYMPVTSKNVPIGAKFTLTLKSGQVIAGSVMMFKNQQFNARAWV